MRQSPLLRRAIDRSIDEQLAATTGEVERLVEAAFRVVAATGVVDPPVRDILAEAGLSTASFYRHFRSKDELMLIVEDEGARMLATYLERRMAREPGPLEQIRAWIAGVLRQAADRRSAERTRPFALVSGTIVSRFPKEHRDMEATFTDSLRRAIEAGVEAGLCRSDDPAFDALTIADCTLGWMSRHLRDRTVPSPALVGQLAGFAYRALGAEPASGKPPGKPPGEEKAAPPEKSATMNGGPNPCVQ